MPAKTPTPRREYRTAQRQVMDATAMTFDLEDRLERLRELLRDLTATLHTRQARQRWDGTTERRLIHDRRA